ncbi:TonB-dependent receptor plug domain-containing protein [Luteimonas aquatica]|uniref:TonB-dependent receptor plug domain-containing protein n=1 Tax=Luteimonas aquatica TaxID=450364 RepID=UPI001F5A05BE|nr:TonB-dependent receptor [Luteimonas aquatica]
MTTTIFAGPRPSPLGTALLAALLLPGAALAQDAAQQQTSDPQAAGAADADSKEATNLDKVSVVGSRIKRSEIEGPSPVTILSSEQIEREGFNTVQDALETLTQATGDAQNEFNSSGGFTPNAGVINLRGLGPGRTLLLVNGRRAADYPFPYNGQSNFQNFNNIPAAAVERIEILAGGASAIYGSDAVAGVINVVLKTNYDGDQLKIRGQTSTRGGRDIGDVQWVGGKTGERSSLTYAFESYNAEPLFGYQRDFMDSAMDNPAPPGVNGRPGVGGYQPPIGAQIRRQGGGTTNSYLFPEGYDCSANPEWRPWTYTSTTTGNRLGPGCGYDGQPAQQTVLNRVHDLSAYLYGTYDFGNGLSAWASAMAYHSRTWLTGGDEQWFGGPQPNGTFFDPQFGVRIQPIRYMTPSAFGGMEGSYQRFVEKSYDFAAGLHGSFGDRFDWDVTLSRSQYDSDRTRPRMTVAGATEYFLGQRLGTTDAGIPIYQLNLDRFYGRISPEDYARMSTQVKYDAKSENNSINFAVTGDLFELPAGPVGFAGILEASKQSYSLKTDPRLLPTRREIYNLTGTGGEGDRNRYAAGIELKIPVLDSLTASLAGRFDKYDDVTSVNDAKTWGAGLEWRPLSNLLIRANYATSFKAPDMHYIFAGDSGTFSQVVDTYRCLQDGLTKDVCAAAGAPARYQYSPFGIRRGTRDLEEETGNSWSTGFVWDVTNDLSVTVDYYSIKLENSIADISSEYILDNEAGCRTGLTPQRQPFQHAIDSEFCRNLLARVTRNPVDDTTQSEAINQIVRGPINTADLRTTGVDASLRYRLDTDHWGRFNYSLSYSHTLKSERREFPGDPIRDRRDDLQNFDFRSRVRSTLTWEKDDWSAALFMLRYGSLPNWLETGRIGPYFIWNASVGKSLTDKVSARFFVNNIFDNISPRDEGFYTYPYFYSAYSPVGREIAAEVTIKFK